GLGRLAVGRGVAGPIILRLVLRRRLFLGGLVLGALATCKCEQGGKDEGERVAGGHGGLLRSVRRVLSQASENGEAPERPNHPGAPSHRTSRYCTMNIAGSDSARTSGS